jgi:hypothetical protein
MFNVKLLHSQELDMYYQYRRIYDAAGMNESEAHIRSWLSAKRYPDGSFPSNMGKQ